MDYQDTLSWNACKQALNQLKTQNLLYKHQLNVHAPNSSSSFVISKPSINLIKHSKLPGIKKGSQFITIRKV